MTKQLIAMIMMLLCITTSHKLVPSQQQTPETLAAKMDRFITLLPVFRSPQEMFSFLLNSEVEKQSLATQVEALKTKQKSDQEQHTHENARLEQQLHAMQQQLQQSQQYAHENALLKEQLRNAHNKLDDSKRTKRHPKKRAAGTVIFYANSYIGK